MREQILSLVCALAVALAPLSMATGCVDNKLPSPREQELDDIRAEMDTLIEERLGAEVPPPIPDDELMVYRLRQHRQQVADEMAVQAAAALTPLAIAVALFAPEGAADLLLSVVPLHKLARARDIARKAFQLRKRNRRSRSLLDLRKSFKAALSDDARDFVRLAEVMTRAERRALRLIHRHTGSEHMLRTLMHKQVRGHADVTWIASKLKAGKLDGNFARRFTFDADFVEHFTGYEANPSWRVLQDIVEGHKVADTARASLASKVVGLLGERAASDIVKSASFRKRFFKGTPGVQSGRGIRYERGHRYGERGSIDIATFSEYDDALFIEVKNWSATTWANESHRNDILEQLQRHNAGVTEILADGSRSRNVAGKVLMVAGDGFRAWGDNKLRGAFVAEIQALGWTLEKMPRHQIRSFDQLIDDLR